MQRPSNFRDVGDFHRKFGLEVTDGSRHPHLLTPELLEFRYKFLQEELKEFDTAAAEGDLPKMADALIDLVYVALGTAHLMSLPWEALFTEVQRANMTKERCEIAHPWLTCPIGGTCASWCPGPSCCHHEGCNAPRHKHSVRGNINDVIKPPGWRAPNIHEVLLAAGWPGPPLPIEEPS